MNLEELRSSVWRRTTESVQFPTDSELITEAKICYFNVHVSVQEEVLCLQEENKEEEEGEERERRKRRRRRRRRYANMLVVCLSQLGNVR